MKRDPLFEHKACVLKKMAQGKSRAEAEAACNKDTSGPSSVLMKNAYFTPKGGPLAQPGALGQMNTGGGQLKASIEHNISAAHGASIGSGAVVRDEPVKAATDWLKSLGRKPTKKDRAGWAEYARRQNMTPDDEAAGWKAIEWAESVFAALSAVFEATSWWGYSVPNLGMVKMQGTAGPASAKAPDGPAWGPVEAFPFHTKVAGKVWDSAKLMIAKYKTAKPLEILRLALDHSKMASNELTPEDAKLLELAISWAQNGAPKPVSKMSGAPGGPFNSTTGDTGSVRRGRP
jgi:hypothetical protein